MSRKSMPLLAGLFFGILHFHAYAQAPCYKDFFGYWKSLDGRYIILFENNPPSDIGVRLAVGNKYKHYEASYFELMNIERNAVSLWSYRFSSLIEGNGSRSKPLIFRFQVLQVDKQSMLIRPLSEDMTNLFGKENVRLFNEQFINYDQVDLDYLSFDYFNIPHVINLKTGQVAKEIRKSSRRQKNKSKLFTSGLDSMAVKKLKHLVMESNILFMPTCEIDAKNCSDCWPFYYRIGYNRRAVIYESEIFHEEVKPLFRYTGHLMARVKWKREKGSRALEWYRYH